ncbi:MAG TPA: hypothetical protein VK638_14485 [Edaphobacter sp.]|nr:hypothetical protein [Edaphobacter sp.]
MRAAKCSRQGIFDPGQNKLPSLVQEPIDAADDPAFLEGTDSRAADDESKALLAELQKLVAQAGGLASA